MKWILLLQLFFCLRILSAQYSLSLCAIFKNEAPYLKEWIEFHKMQGVEHFFLYDNLSKDNFQEVLEPYLQRQEVTLIHWPFYYTHANGEDWLKIQTDAYMDAIIKFGPSSDWIGFIDIDEFLFCPTGEPLPLFLSRYEEFGGLVVNWLMFGTSGIEELPIGGLITEHLTQCAPPTHPFNWRVKTIVKPNRVMGCCQPHCFKYLDLFFAVNCDRVPMKPGLNGPSISHDKIRINHYWTKTERYFRKHKIPSRKMRREKENVENLKRRKEDFNQTSDFAIQQFVPELKRRIEKIL